MSNTDNTERTMAYPTLNTATDPKIREQLEAKRARVIQKLGPIGRFMVKTRAVRMWRDGDGVSFLVNWWNPVAWLWLVVAVLGVFVVSGFSGVSRNLDEIGVRMSSYWRENREARERITARDL